MNISLNIFKNVPRALGPNEYAVIFKMLLCQYHDISSKSNRCTSPKSIFVCVIAMELPETLNKDKHVEGLPKSRPSHQSVTQSLNWVLSPYPHTGRKKNFKKCHPTVGQVTSSSWLHTGKPESPCSSSLHKHCPFIPSQEEMKLPSGSLMPYSQCISSNICCLCHPQVCHRWQNFCWTLGSMQESGHSDKSQWSF